MSFMTAAVLCLMATAATLDPLVTGDGGRHVQLEEARHGPVSASTPPLEARHVPVALPTEASGLQVRDPGKFSLPTSSASKKTWAKRIGGTVVVGGLVGTGLYQGITGIRDEINCRKDPVCAKTLERQCKPNPNCPANQPNGQQQTPQAGQIQARENTSTKPWYCACPAPAPPAPPAPVVPRDLSVVAVSTPRLKVRDPAKFSLPSLKASKATWAKRIGVTAVVGGSLGAGLYFAVKGSQEEAKKEAKCRKDPVCAKTLERHCRPSPYCPVKGQKLKRSVETEVVTVDADTHQLEVRENTTHPWYCACPGEPPT